MAKTADYIMTPAGYMRLSDGSGFYGFTPDGEPFLIGAGGGGGGVAPDVQKVEAANASGLAVKIVAPDPLLVYAADKFPVEVTNFDLENFKNIRNDKIYEIGLYTKALPKNGSYGIRFTVPNDKIFVVKHRHVKFNGSAIYASWRRGATFTADPPPDGYGGRSLRLPASGATVNLQGDQSGIIDDRGSYVGGAVWDLGIEGGANEMTGAYAGSNGALHHHLDPDQQVFFVVENRGENPCDLYLGLYVEVVDV